MTDDEARLWEIAENLHRAELSKLERDDNVTEWIKITVWHRNLRRQTRGAEVISLASLALSCL